MTGGITMGGSIHIGNLLGANQPRRAQTTATVMILFTSEFTDMMIWCIEAKDDKYEIKIQAKI